MAQRGCGGIPLVGTQFVPLSIIRSNIFISAKTLRTVPKPISLKPGITVNGPFMRARQRIDANGANFAVSLKTDFMRAQRAPSQATIRVE
jgi:hypothetical protein